jgi:YidC/Oxa1 family membrane protein insertase
MHDQNNVFYAIALSVVILITWQYFFATSFLGKPTAQKTAQVGVIASGTDIIRPQAQAIATQPAVVPSAPQASRPDALARSQRIAIATPRLKGSIALTGGRIDDPDPVPRNHRSEIAGDRTAFAVRQPAAILCGIRLGRCLRH